MKKIYRILSLMLIVVSFVFFALTGCGEDSNIKKSGTAYNNKDNDYKYLLGICETPYVLMPEVDKGLTTEWITHVIKSMGIKSYRIWAHIDNLVIVKEDDSVSLNQEYADRITRFVDALKDAGVEKLSILMSSRLHITEDGTYALSSVPDPTVEYDKYYRGLIMEEKAYELIAKEFQKIDYFECINEPDHRAGHSINKKGFIYNPNATTTGEYNFNTEETVKICMDYNWYIRRGIKKGNPNAKIMFPALCNYPESPQFLEKAYEAIYSKKLPSGQEYSDTDPDNYFDVLNWHPYLGGLFGIGEEIGEPWIQRQKDFYAVAEKYGDAEKPVWFTEYGFSDAGNPQILGSVKANGETGKAPVNSVAILKTIKEELPFVETVCFFRITDMYSAKYDVAGENTFGYFYNPYDPVNLGKPKPSAVAIVRYMNGGKITQEQMQELCKYYYAKNGDIPEEYKCVITK